jgi:hypothetical protein
MQYFGITSETFTTLLLACGGAVVIMYLFKLRRRRVRVPYSAFWQQLLSERQTRSLWHRIKRWLSLLLQLLIVATLLFALRDPRPEGAFAEGRHIVIVVDTSASMATRDGPADRDRMESAREAALASFDQLGPDDRVMVVQSDAQLRPLTPFVAPSEPVRALVRQLDYTATRGDLGEAVAFAVRALRGRTRPELVVISDGAVSDAELERIEAQTAGGWLETRFIRFGESIGNLAITRFNVRRYPANRLNYEVFVQAQSYFEVPVEVDLELFANGGLVERMRVHFAPGETIDRVYPNLATGGHRLEARLSLVTGDANDVFPLDDTAYALLPDERKTQVLLVTSDDLFVEAPFVLNQNLQLTRLTPAEYEATGGSASDAVDVTVFSGIAPATPERGNFLYFFPEGEHAPWEVRGEVRAPIIDRFDREDPLMRWIHGFRGVNIARALRLRATRADEVVARSIAGDPMILRRSEDGHRAIGVAFPVRESDFALRVTYPLFTLNAIDWLIADSAPLVQTYTTGRAWRVYLGTSEPGGAWVVRPDGSAEARSLVDGYLTFYAATPGFYDVYFGAPPADSATDAAEEVAFSRPERPPDEVVAANFANAAESDIRPHPDFPASSDEAEALASHSPFGHRDPWVYLLTAISALLLIEWVTFNRRITV